MNRPRILNRRNCTAALLGIVVWCGTILWIAWSTDGGHRLPYDAFRDTAWSINMIEGAWWADPTLAGATWWYAPAGPLTTAALSSVLDIPPPTIQARSALVVNPLIAILLFLLVNREAGPWTAAAAIPFLVVGSLWWMTHIGAAMPSIQGAVPGLLAVAAGARLFDRTTRSGPGVYRWALATGLLLGLTAWWHPVCATVAASSLTGLALLTVIRRTTPWPRVAAGLGTAALVSFGVSLPFLVHLAALPRINATPMRYIARETANPDFAVGWHTPGVLVLAVIGLVAVCRSRPGLGWTVGMLGAAVIGQAPAYLPAWRNSGLPFVVPHEFQWHGQVAVAVLAAVGLGQAVSFARERVPMLERRRWVAPAAAGLVLIGTLTPALPLVPLRNAYLTPLDAVEQRYRETVGWIRSHSGIDDIFVAPEHEAYLVVGGLTGRKCHALPPGHTNPSVDRVRRAATVTTVLTSPNQGECLEAAREADADFVLLILTSREAWTQFERMTGWPSFDLLFSSHREGSAIFRPSGRGTPAH